MKTYNKASLIVTQSNSVRLWVTYHAKPLIKQTDRYLRENNTFSRIATYKQAKEVIQFQCNHTDSDVNQANLSDSFLVPSHSLHYYITVVLRDTFFNPLPWVNKKKNIFPQFLQLAQSNHRPTCTTTVSTFHSANQFHSTEAIISSFLSVWFLCHKKRHSISSAHLFSLWKPTSHLRGFKREELNAN